MMRPINRVPLTRPTLSWLQRQQAELNRDQGADASRRWTARRAAMKKNGILDALKLMAGRRNRCMYCGDSEACDIEHFKPKSKAAWRASVFDWNNLLWICQPCNRLKNASFPVIGGRPVMLDPSVDNIWDYLEFSPETGYLVPQCDLDDISRFRAEQTISESNSRLSFQVILEERKRAYRQLRRAALKYQSSEKSEGDVNELLEGTLDSGYPELVKWAYALSGSLHPPFNELSLDEGLKNKIKNTINEAYPGAW